MSLSRTVAVRWSTRAVAVLAASAAFVLPTVATAQTSTPDSTASAALAQAAQLHQEVTNGTLLNDHGTRPVCEHCDAVVVTQGGTISQRNAERLGFRVAYSKVTVIKQL